MQRLNHLVSRLSVCGSCAFSSSSSSMAHSYRPTTTPLLGPPSSTLSQSCGGFLQPLRHGSKYVVNDLSPLWYRRRTKAMRQRLKVIRPNTPLIDHLFPLPATNEGRYPSSLFQPQDEPDPRYEGREKQGIVAEINRQLDTKDHGRLFAVVHIQGKQFKVTPEDIIIIQGYWAPNIGDRIRFHKVMLVGGTDFTVVGRPMLDLSMARVEGTIIEKTLSYLKLHFILLKRQNYRRLKFYKTPYTMIRINMVELLEKIEAPSQEEADSPVVIQGTVATPASAPDDEKMVERMGSLSSSSKRRRANE